MSADEIRKYVFINYIQPARKRGEKQVVVRVGDVHNGMGLKSRLSAVYAALGTNKFQDDYNVRLIKREGPSNGANAFFTYVLERLPITRKFIVTLQPDEDGFIVASCPALPGCHSQGRTKEEAIANITEAIRGYIVSMGKHGESILTTEVEEVEVAV